MKEFKEILEEESEKLGILRPRFFRYEQMLGFVTGLYHGKGPSSEKDPDNPKGSIGAFARMNYYRILVEKLKTLLRSLESNGHIPRGAGRIYCNSRFPEKSFAFASNFGVRGKNSLVIVPSLGSFLVLGGILFPHSFEIHMEPAPLVESNKEEFPLCGTCRLCQEACPTGAIVKPGGVNPNRCLQAYASQPCFVPEDISAKWGSLFYGCDTCQEVCPYNRKDNRAHINGTSSLYFFDDPGGSGIEQLPPATKLQEKWGYLGSGIELGRVLETRDDDLRKGVFRHTVLDIGWITPHTLKRNALLALSHLPISSNWITSRWQLLTEYGNSQDLILRSAAEYTMKKTRSKVRYI